MTSTGGREIVLQLIIALVGMIALIAGVIAVYYAISYPVLRCFGLLFPLAGRKRGSGRTPAGR